MSRPASRSRRHIIVVILLMLSVGLVALDRRGRMSSRVRTLSSHLFAPSQGWLRGFTLSLVGRGAERRDADASGPADAAGWQAAMARAEQDNARLAAKAAELERQLREMRRIIGQLSDYPLMLVPAHVLSRDYVLPESIMTIDAGSRQGVSGGHWVVTAYISQGKTAGVRKGEAVVDAEGVIGLVEQVGPHVSRVKLITSDRCSLAARVMHWNASAGQWVAQAEIGVTRGSGDGRTLHLQHIPKSVAVCPGDYVVTASGDTGMTGSLIIGQVTEVLSAPAKLTYDITVRPRVDLDKLGRVYVLSPRGDTQEK